MDGWRAGVPSAFLASVIFLLFMPLMQRINMRAATKQMLKMPIEGEEDAILCGGANHFKNGEAVGGKMILFHDELVFKSHRFNLQPHQLHISLEDIIDVSPYQVLGIAPNGLKITRATGEPEKFVVGNRAEWIDVILIAKTVNG